MSRKEHVLYLAGDFSSRRWSLLIAKFENPGAVRGRVSTLGRKAVDIRICGTLLVG